MASPREGHYAVMHMINTAVIESFFQSKEVKVFSFQQIAHGDEAQQNEGSHCVLTGAKLRLEVLKCKVDAYDGGYIKQDTTYLIRDRIVALANEVTK